MSPYLDRLRQTLSPSSPDDLWVSEQRLALARAYALAAIAEALTLLADLKRDAES